MTLIVAFLHKNALSPNLKMPTLHSEQNCLLSAATDIDGAWSNANLDASGNIRLTVQMYHWQTTPDA